MRRRTANLAGLALLVLAVGLLPEVLGTGRLFFWTTAIIAVLFATTVNLLFGVADIPSFGQAAFFGAGAYTVAMLSPHSWSAPLALLAGIGVAGGVACAASLFTWRLTGLAFAMLTLAIAQGMYTLVVKTDALGGYNGLPGVVAPELGPLNLLDPTVFWYFTAACVALGLAAFWAVGRSPFGHTLRSIRENPSRAIYLGINVRAYRALAFVIAGCGAGLAGGLSAYSNQIVTPGALYWTASATPIIMLLLGGRSYFWGPAIGAVVLSGLLDYLTEATTAYVFYVGLLLLALLIFLPEGVLSLPRVLRRLARRSRGPRPVDAGVPSVDAAPTDAAASGGRS
ncbi:MAG TPA: branched-chain amino acid ABC transporter permease [Actinomycetes bacterium]|nr:branched-chain amino acid ABC transporter permease [Actinomycetes bacterium]